MLKVAGARQVIRAAILALLLLLPCGARAQQPESNPLALEPGAYTVGFRLLEGEDRSRSVTGGVGLTSPPAPGPNLSLVSRAGHRAGDALWALCGPR